MSVFAKTKLSKSAEKKVRKIIKDHYLTEAEFIVEMIAPEVEDYEFDVDAIVDILTDIKAERDM